MEMQKKTIAAAMQEATEEKEVLTVDDEDSSSEKMNESIPSGVFLESGSSLQQPEGETGKCN